MERRKTYFGTAREIYVSFLTVGVVLLGVLGGTFLLAQSSAVVDQPSITIDEHLNFGAYTVTPMQLNNGEKIECNLKSNGNTECNNATPVGNWAQVGEFTIIPEISPIISTDLNTGNPYTTYEPLAFIKVSYIEGSFNLKKLKEAGVELVFRFRKKSGPAGDLKKSTGTSSSNVADLTVFNPLESPEAYMIFVGDTSVSVAANVNKSPRVFKVYGKLIVSDPVKFFAYRTKHNIKDASKVLGTLNFKVATTRAGTD